MEKDKNSEEALFESIMGPEQDPVITILRVHLLTEYYLERLAQVMLPRADRILDGGNLTYYQKLALADSLDALRDKIMQCLKNLNKLRNRISHDMEKKVTLGDVENLARPLGKLCTEYRRKSEGSVGVFLHLVLSYISGYITGQVKAIEERHVPEVDTKAKNAK